MVLCLALWAWPWPAGAHDADVLYVLLERAPGGIVTERVTLTPDTLDLLAPGEVDGGGPSSQQELDARGPAIEAGVWDSMPLSGATAPCVRQEARASWREGYVELAGRFRCPEGELRQTFRLLSVLPPGYQVILGTRGEGAGGQRFARGNVQTLFIDSAAGVGGGQAAAAPSLAGWIRLGVFHIFTGYDHLAFLVALLLVGQGWWRVLGLVTSFTVAHSLTLGAAALDLVPLSPVFERWVEGAIAASIVYVAAENLIRQEHRHRALVTFGFGLIHGFGFASVLRGYGLGEAAVRGLLGFNLGVEAGQACIVLVLFPVVRALRRSPGASTWVTRLVSAGILAAGGFWLVNRTVG